MAPAASATDMAGHELVITRVFDAPRALVFKVWTQPEHLVRWLGPRDFTTPSAEMDVRPGGAYRACIRSPAGEGYWMRGVYREIVEPERLVFTFAWEEEGERGRETLITVTFADADGKTKLTFHQATFASVEQRDSHQEGWNECLDRLQAYLASASPDEVGGSSGSMDAAVAKGDGYAGRQGSDRQSCGQGLGRGEEIL